VVRGEVTQQLRFLEHLGVEQRFLHSFAATRDQVQDDFLLFRPNQTVRYEAFEETSVPRLHG